MKAFIVRAGRQDKDLVENRIRTIRPGRLDPATFNSTQITALPTRKE